MSEESHSDLKCDCGSTRFTQHALYNVTETVALHYEGTDIYVDSHSLNDINENDIEHLNEFRCIACGAVYTLARKDGEDKFVKEEL